VLCISYTHRIFVVGIETDGQRKRDGERERERERQRERDRPKETERASMDCLRDGQRQRRERCLLFDFLLLIIEDFYI
jgi:hypothetical protein